MFFNWRQNCGVHKSDNGFYDYAEPTLPYRGIDNPLRLSIGPARSVPNAMAGAGVITGMPFATGGPATYHNFSMWPIMPITGAGVITGGQGTNPQTK